MKVILLDNYYQLGFVGDEVAVRPGYARNYLIPRGIAIEASSRNERVLKHKLGFVLAKRARMKKNAEEMAESLKNVALDFTIKVGEGGKAFGGVSVKEIERKFADLGFAIDKTQIKLADVIKKAGEYKIGVKLHAEVLVQIPCKVTAEAPKKEAAPAEGAEKGKRRAPRKKKAEGSATGDAAVPAETAPVAE